MSEPADACLFCRIVAGEIPADVVYEDADTLAFRDISPQAPTHVLVVPRRHFADVNELTAGDPELAARVLATAGRVAEQEQVGDFRLVLNTGAGAGQSVFHVHAHVLGGREMRWPPG